ncbi:LCP family protein [Micropruina sp.]|uniref:LCP family protein n=1 Tax=Micropruina sp. TaxID=2737536 RepID=UPI0026186E21|nr:LCP family protein [Micropruina sp.]
MFLRVGTGVLACLLAVIIVAGAAVGSLWLSASGIHRSPSLLPVRDAAGSPGAPGSLNLLLVGDDGQQPRASATVLLVVHIDSARERVDVVSLPRNLMVTSVDGSRQRLSRRYTDGGPASVVQSVESLLGIRIDHVALTRLEGMSRLIDMLGGVPVNNPVQATTGEYTFVRGPITLTGPGALAFVRQDDTNIGGIDREESQRLVLQGIVERLLTSKALLNPGTVKAVLDQLAGDIVVDSGLDARALVELFVDVRLLSTQQRPETIKLPTAGAGVTDAGLSYLLPDQARVAALGRALNTDAMESWGR